MSAVFVDPDVMRFGPGMQKRDWVATGWPAASKRTTASATSSGRSPPAAGGPRICGKGYATEAARLVGDHAFDALRLQRVISLVDPGNRASIRVAEKPGMRHEADVMLDGYDHADRVYAMEPPHRSRGAREPDGRIAPGGCG